MYRRSSVRGPSGSPVRTARVVLLDGQHDIEAHPVHEPEGRNAGAGEDAPHLVDVLGSRHPLFDDHQTFALYRRPDAVENEAVALAPDVEWRQAVRGECGRERIDDTRVRPAAGHQLDRVELRR